MKIIRESIREYKTPLVFGGLENKGGFLFELGLMGAARMEFEYFEGMIGRQPKLYTVLWTDNFLSVLVLIIYDHDSFGGFG